MLCRRLFVRDIKLLRLQRLHNIILKISIILKSHLITTCCRRIRYETRRESSRRLSKDVKEIGKALKTRQRVHNTRLKPSHILI